MLLNRLEKALMNNPLRAAAQRHYEAPLLVRLGGRLDGQRVLEIGCGRGVGTEILFRQFGAREVHAFDLDPDMVARARRRLAGYPPERLQLTVGDAAAIAEPDESFDAVVDFGIIHHVPEWHKAVAEVRRVLRRGGRFFFERLPGTRSTAGSIGCFSSTPGKIASPVRSLLPKWSATASGVDGNFRYWWFGDYISGAGIRE